MLWPYDLGTEFTISNCLFGAVRLTENADVDKYRYNGYHVNINASSFLSLSNRSSFGKNVINSGIDNCSLFHVDKKKNHILIFGKDKLEAKYSVNFTAEQMKFSLSLNYNGSNSFLYVTCVKNNQF